MIKGLIIIVLLAIGVAAIMVIDIGEKKGKHE